MKEKAAERARDKRKLDALPDPLEAGAKQPWIAFVGRDDLAGSAMRTGEQILFVLIAVAGALTCMLSVLDTASGSSQHPGDPPRFGYGVLMLILAVLIAINANVRASRK